LLQNILFALAYFAVASLLVVLTVFVFTMLTKYNDWEEIGKGNLAASMVLGGKVFGVGNIVRFAIISNETLIQSAIWGCIGLVLLLAVYLCFDWLTPKLNVNDEIAAGNKAVGFISMFFSITFSYVIGASIT